ncbi:MAG: tetratricopeptide repeat protein [Desulfomonile tiedjei]|uniref:Tetratricopeptide repeat protein n=1 Tax=Desulfomonile tiedjei TaxID=2358 RepID=A0A9D6Z3I6_9BACT|nr:tetratricopeptide repeat protein [Desulfomonile tiedjei]
MAATIMLGRRTIYTILFATFLLILLALHYRAFHAPLYYDSTYLQENEHAFASGELTKVISLFPQRPLAMTSFYLNYLISGLTPSHFRMVNALLMAGTALMVVLIILILQGITYGSDPGIIPERRLIALFLGLFFLVHPIQTFLVLYIWQRMALLSAFFYCAAFLAYLVTRSGRFEPKWAGYLTCSVMFLLGIASKENAVTFPATIILAEIAFFKVNWKTVLKRAALLAAAMVLLVAIFSFLERPHGEITRDPGVLATIRQYYFEGAQTPAQVLISQCQMIFRYLGLILLPLPSTVQFISPQIMHTSLLESPGAIAGLIGAAAFTGLGLYLLRRRPLAGFGIMFFLINLLPEAVLVPQYLFIVYRAMLPMIGILFAAADGLDFALAKIRQAQAKNFLRAALAAGLCLCIALTALSTVRKARSWEDPKTLWTDVVNHLPADYSRAEKWGTLQALNNLGLNLRRAGKHDEAVYYHLRALEVSPNWSETYTALADAYADVGEKEKAGQAYSKALKAKPNFHSAHAGLANLLIRENRIEDAKPHLKKAIDIAPNKAEYRNLMGILVLKEGNNSEALLHFSKAVELKPNYGEAHFHLGKALSKVGRTSEAAFQYSKALELDPNYWQAHNDLGIILAKAGRIEDAIFHFQEALKTKPDDQAVKANLGNALKQMGAFLKK